MTKSGPKIAKKHYRPSTVRAKNRIIQLLRRQQRRSPELALTTPVIADVLGYGKRTWRLLDILYDEDIVDRSPALNEKPVKYLRDSITGKTYFPQTPAVNAFLKRVSRLAQLALSSPNVLQILGCTLNDIRGLSNLGDDLKQYNTYIITLRHHNIARDLPLLQWRRKPVKWWLT